MVETLNNLKTGPFQESLESRDYGNTAHKPSWFVSLSPALGNCSLSEISARMIHFIGWGAGGFRGK